ncbi:MAG: permease [Desulfuromusa sp.]|nr:permease [Desulfuromusa sp.]
MNDKSEQSGSIGISASLRKTGKMLLRIFPNILAIVLLSGLIVEFVPLNRLSELLGGGFFTDGLVGAGIGSISIGNPLVSYVLGGELLDQGISLMAVTALLVSWVTVGSIQLPAEIQTFGTRFALLRNGISFLFALIIAFLVLMTMQLLTGGFQ